MTIEYPHICCNYCRKALQDHGLNQEVLNILRHFIDATPSEIEVRHLGIEIAAVLNRLGLEHIDIGSESYIT